MDLTNTREKFQEHLKELKSMQSTMKRYHWRNLANHNQQSTKNPKKTNIELLGWKKKAQENLCEDLCTIMKDTAGVTIDPSDILAIIINHRIPRGEGKTRPDIAKFKNSEAKFKVIQNRPKEEKKKLFLMFDHLMQMNLQLLRELNSNVRTKSAWNIYGSNTDKPQFYENGKKKKNIQSASN